MGRGPLDTVLGDARRHDVRLVAAPARLAHLAHLHVTQHCPIRDADSRLSSVKPISDFAPHHDNDMLSLYRTS